MSSLMRSASVPAGLRPILPGRAGGCVAGPGELTLVTWALNELSILRARRAQRLTPTGCLQPGTANV